MGSEYQIPFQTLWMAFEFQISFRWVWWRDWLDHSNFALVMVGNSEVSGFWVAIIILILSAHYSCVIQIPTANALIKTNFNTVNLPHNKRVNDCSPTTLIILNRVTTTVQSTQIKAVNETIQSPYDIIHVMTSQFEYTIKYRETCISHQLRYGSWVARLILCTCGFLLKINYQWNDPVFYLL